MERVLWIDIGGQWEQIYAKLTGPSDEPARLFRVFERKRMDLPASLSNCSTVIAHFSVERGFCEVRKTTISMAAMSRLLKSKVIPPAPHFFNVVTSSVDEFAAQTGNSTTYRFCAPSEQERSMWMDAINALCNNGKPSKALPRSPLQRIKSYPGGASPKILSTRPHHIIHTSSAGQRLGGKPKQAAVDVDGKELYSHDPRPEDLQSPNGVASNKDPGLMEEIKEDGADETTLRLCGSIKMPTPIYFLLCIAAYPLSIIFLIFKVTQNKNLQFMRSLWFVWPVNGAIAYGLPIVLVDVVLQKFVKQEWVLRLTMGLYCAFVTSFASYLSYCNLNFKRGVGLGAEGTFSFKPSLRVRWNLANAIQLAGIILDWLLMCTMVLPSSMLHLFSTETVISAVPPYLPFTVYFWTAFSLALYCAVVLLLNSALKGKGQYRLRHSRSVWYLFNTVSAPGGGFFMTILIILLMSLQCNYLGTPSTQLYSLLPDPSVRCFSNAGIMRARAGAVGFGLFFLQSSMLPAATFKESLVELQDISYLPIYLSLQCVLQLSCAYFFVFFYQEEAARVIALSVLNCAQLAANHFLRPCSVGWVNTVRDVLMLSACLISVHSLNLLGWGFGSFSPQYHATAAFSLSTVISTAVFAALAAAVSHVLRQRNAEHGVALAFLEIEYEVSQGEDGKGEVSPRALEPLIALSQSTDPDDWAVCKKYIGQLVFLLSYPSLRVQFQAAWALANIALLDEEARIKIHEAGGTAALQNGYGKMGFMAQLEALAALANLTLSPRIANELAKQADCIPFFMELVQTQAQAKTMHCVFACIALGNLARNEVFRDIIRRSGGFQAMVRCIMSQHYQKRKYGMSALANLALSPVPEVQQLFQAWPGLLDRLVKTASSNELDTQREVVALIRNLAAHSKLRPLLLEKGVMGAMHFLRNSPIDEVVRWTEDLTQSIERELAATGVVGSRSGPNMHDDAEAAAADAEALRRLEPLDGRVDWATWGSKLDALFTTIYTSAPPPAALAVSTFTDEPVLICLANSLSRDTVHRWADSLSFVITRQPRHGALVQAASSHLWTYSSKLGFSGVDYFWFRAQLGSALSSAAKCEITVDSLVELGDVYRRGGQRGSGGSSNREWDDQSFQSSVGGGGGGLESPTHENSYFEDDDEGEGGGEGGADAWGESKTPNHSRV